MRSAIVTEIFLALGMAAAAAGLLFARLGRRHRRRLPLVESALAIILIYPLLTAFGAIPFWLSGWLNPLDATLETISDLTSAGILLLPEFSGCFGMTLSLHGGQNFSPIFDKRSQNVQLKTARIDLLLREACEQNN